METRRAHGECAVGKGGCEVVIGASCGGARGRGKGRLVGRLLWRGGIGKVEVPWTVWVIGLLLTSFVANVCFAIRWYFD